MAAALCAGLGGHAARWSQDGLHASFRGMRWTALDAQVWEPGRDADGRLAIFHGYFDNAEAIRAELGLDSTEPPRLYAAAVAAWGNDADRRVIGEYCAAIVDPVRGTLRLARSPLKAPPLVYARGAGVLAAASVARALFAAGIPRELDMQRTVDSAMHNVLDAEGSWFRGVRRVPLGAIVELDRSGGEPRLRRYYTIGDVPPVRLSPEACVARAGELLDEAVRACLAGSSRPGSTLSSGLDSPQVALRALAQLPPGERLPTFTFHPEAGWDGIEEPGTLGNERPAVEALAARYPGLEPHFVDNAGYGHDYRWNDMFTLMDSGCASMPLAYVMHGVFQRARERGCDLLLMAEWGNQTFSESGEWAYVEYFLKGRWRQLWLALTRAARDQRSAARRFVALCLVPLLPNSLWKRLMAWWHRDEVRILELMIPLRAEFRQASGADARLEANSLVYDRYQPRSRKHANVLNFAMLDFDTSEAFQALQLLYGLPCRDPTTYRPFVEFCLGLPTDMFMRDGEPRWLAKQLAKGMLPPEQAANPRNGRWDADWLLRMRRNRDTYYAELDRIEGDEELSAMIDVPRLRAALDALPERTPTRAQDYTLVRHGLIGGLLTARFINHARGRN